MIFRYPDKDKFEHANFKMMYTCDNYFLLYDLSHYRIPPEGFKDVVVYVGYDSFKVMKNNKDICEGIEASIKILLQRYIEDNPYLINN